MECYPGSLGVAILKVLYTLPNNVKLGTCKDEDMQYKDILD